jgi:hypothetical protein
MESNSVHKEICKSYRKNMKLRKRVFNNMQKLFGFKGFENFFFLILEMQMADQCSVE